jgi:hypothetical protein
VSISKQTKIGNVLVSELRYPNGRVELSFLVPPVVKGCSPILVASISGSDKGWLLRSAGHANSNPFRDRSIAERRALADAETYYASIEKLYDKPYTMDEAESD